MTSRAPIRLWRLVFKHAKTRAATIIKDPKKLVRLIQEAIAKMDRHKGALKEILDDLKLIFRLLKAWINGDYREVSLETIILLIAAVAYFLMPIDAIIDAIPVIGYVDDIAVIGFVLASVKGEVDKFRQWEKSKQTDMGPEVSPGRL